MRYLALISILLSSASGQIPNLVYDSAMTAGQPLTELNAKLAARGLKPIPLQSEPGAN